MPPLIFFGSSPFSAIVLEKVLSAKCKVLSAVTTPNKPVGRHLKLTPNPVKLLAQKNNIPTYENITPFPPLNLRGGIEEGDIVGLVAAYGKIIPQNILDKFNGQIYNIHPSLLPKYRGPSPLQQQILDGVIETGVTIIQIDFQMDHGPIVAFQKDIIQPNDTWITLGNRLFAKGTDLFIENYLEFENCKLKIQDDSLASYTKKLTRQDGFIPWEQFESELDARRYTLDAKLRAYYPWPGIWTTDPEGKRVKLISLNPIMVQYPGHKPQSYA